jgi:uncharacterized protein (UPF0332 family)
MTPEYLADNQKWNSAINRLYYAAYYAVIALLLQYEHKPTTHNGAKSQFSEHFIKTKIFPEEYGKLILSVIYLAAKRRLC